MKILVILCCHVALLTLVGCVSPIQTTEENNKNRDLLQNQISLMSDQQSDKMLTKLSLNKTSQTAPLINGIYLGIALDGASSAFEGDIKRVQELLFSKIITGPSLLLSNKSATNQIYPRADFNTIPSAAKAIGNYINDFRNISNDSFRSNGITKQPLFAVVNLSSHGKNNHLRVRIGSNRIQGEISDEYLQKILNDTDGMHKPPMLLIISACNSGSFIPRLAAPNRIIITAAAIDKSSFGCDSTSKYTVFTEFLLDEPIKKSLSLKKHFEAALKRIDIHEKKMNYPNSLPQIYVGENVLELYEAPIESWNKILSN